MQKRGQLNTISYVLLAALAVAIMLFGAHAIATIQSGKQDVELAGFWSSLSSDAEAVSSRIGATRKLSYAMPVGVTKVCFADASADPKGIGSVEMQRFPLILDAVHNGNSNVFLMGASFFESHHIENLRLSNKAIFACLGVVGSKLDLTLKGTGNGAIIAMNYVVGHALELAAGKMVTRDTIIVSPDGLLKLYVPAGTLVSGADTISIEIVPQSASYDLSSEEYQLGPSGATFNPPIMLTLKYYPEIVGNCPDSLLFYHFNNNGDLIGSAPLQAERINCEDHTAIFRISSFSSYVLV
jgi:hypothetical protein